MAAIAAKSNECHDPGTGEFCEGPEGSGGEAALTSTKPRDLGKAPAKEVMSHHNAMSADWRKGLSEPEHFELRRYTGQIYNVVNQDLRTDPDKWAKDKIIQTLDAALSKASLKEDTTVYRGVSDLSKLGIDPSNAVGHTIKDHAYMSTSLSAKSAEKYAGTSGGIIKINAPSGSKGASVGGITRYPKEAEILFKRGSGIKIRKVTKQKNGTHLIEADLV
jgi:hypothetical protein